MRMSRNDWLLVVILSLLWGGAFIFIEIALQGFPPTTLVFVRITLAAAALWGWIRLRGGRIAGGARLWGAYALLGLLNMALPFVLISWSMTHITAGLAAILNATMPLWGVIVAHLFTVDEKATPARLAGVGFGFAGVVVMIGGDALGGAGGNLLPQIVCLIATFSYALAVVYGRRFTAWGVDPIEVAAGQLIAAALLLLPVALIADAPWALPVPGALPIAALVALAIFSSTIAYALYFRLLASAGAVASTLPTFLIPPITVLLGLLILGERLEPRHWWGMALIALGLAAIDGRLMPGRAGRTARPG